MHYHERVFLLGRAETDGLAHDLAFRGNGIARAAGLLTAGFTRCRHPRTCIDCLRGGVQV